MPLDLGKPKSQCRSSCRGDGGSRLRLMTAIGSPKDAHELRRLTTRPIGRKLGKYDGLRDHLLSRAGMEATVSFDDVASLVPGGLPASAYQYQAWWANDESGSHVQLGHG